MEAEPGLDTVPLVRAPHGVEPAIWSLMLGTFLVGTGEFGIMGMLPEFARSLNLSLAQASGAIPAYAMGVVFGAPLFAIIGATWPRRRFLLALVTVFCIGNFLSALAPTLPLIEAARFLAGLPHGAFFGVSALVAASLFERARRGRAVGRVLTGIMVSTVVGAPLSTFAAEQIGWRMSYLSLGVLSLLLWVCVWRYTPSDPAHPGASALRELGAFRRPQVLLTLATGAIGFGGLFAVYSFLTATLDHVTHLSGPWRMTFLVIWGAGMVAGNHFGSQLIDRNLDQAAIGSLLFSVVFLIGFSLLVKHPVLLAIDTFLLPATLIVVSPAMQTRLMEVADDAQTLAASLNHSAFNLANAIGAALGGLLIGGGYGYASVGWCGAALSIIGLAIYLVTIRLARNGQHHHQLAHTAISDAAQGR
jgi:MFS transporter, DHA1 family, inner membrane transport protein